MKKLLSLFTALVLCTAMWGATYKTFYKVQGVLYQGINVDFTTNKNMFAPNGATVTYTTFDGKTADWYANGIEKKKGASSYTTDVLDDANYFKYQIKNYTGYDAQDPKIDYIYGTSSSDYLLRVGSDTMYMMSMANAYAVCTEDSKTPTNVGKYYVDNKSMLTLGASDAKTYGTSMKYGTNFSYEKNGGLIFAYEMLVDNPGEMYIDYIVLPIYASSKDNTKSITDMIPNDAELTLTLYPIDLTLASDGKYSYTRKTPSIATVTATKGNFTADGTNTYRGTVKFTPKNPLLISGDFVARLTWDEDCEFGLITDDNNLQNFTTFYLWKDDKGSITKSYMWGTTSANASISYHAMFPTLESKDKSTELTIPSTWTEKTEKKISFRSNISPESDGFNIDTEGDWITFGEKSFSYSGTTYKQSGTNYITFDVTAGANKTGETREATITLKHHGKELTYTVTQAPMITQINLQGMLSLKVNKTYQLGVSVLPAAAELKEITWSSNNEAVATVDADGKVTSHAHGKATITATFNNDIKATCEVTVFGVEPVEDPTTTTITAPAAGGNTTTVSFTLAAGLTFDEKNWSVNKTDGPDWITDAKFTSLENDDGSTTVTCTLTASLNNTGSDREDSITVTAFTDKFKYAISQRSLAYYDLPAGAFFAGMTKNGAAADKTFYLPYQVGQQYTFKSTETGDWTFGNGSGSKTSDQKEYSYSNRTMKDSCHTPLLAVEGKEMGYQYGASGESYNANLYFHIGDSVMHYMTPARIYDEAGKITQKAIPNYRTINRDTIGVFFNNTDVMYIDSISIPISFGGSSGYTLDAMFPSDAKVYAKIYQATQTTGKSGNKFDRESEPLRTIELTQSCFKPRTTNSYRGVLEATVGEPLDITGSFVIELTNLKKSGCSFYIYAAQERPGCNKWGYYVGDDGKETYPNYTPAISVHAMFPVLYTNGSEDIKIPIKGGSEKRTVFANYKWIKNENGWKREDMDGVTMNYETKTFSADSTEWYFKMSENTTTEAREGYVTFTFRGKELKFHVIQPPTVNSITISETELNLVGNETPTLTATVLPKTTTQDVTWVSEDETIATVDETGKVTAVGVGTTNIKAISADPDKYATCEVTVTATLTPRTGTDNKQTFTFLAAGDDTLLINGTKTAKIYLDSEVKLNSNNIQVVSKQGLTKIDKGYGSTVNFIRLTLTRKQFVPEEAKDTVVVYFKNNPSIEYKYYITQAGCGKLRPDTTCRTFVVGPKGGNALFLNDDNTVGGRYVRLYSDVPASNTIAYYYKKDFFKIVYSYFIDAEGHYYTRVSASVEGETTVERLDSFYMCLPNCDTIKFYVRQEPTHRVWQLAADQLTTLEVGNKGGLAHFKGYKNTEMILVSNIPIEENEVNVTCADWITATPVINASKDTVRITFTVVDEYKGKEARTDSMKITVQGNEFTMPLTQKVFSIEWTLSGGGSELVIPVEGGKTTYLNILGTEPYREGLLQITIPDGVSITDWKTETISTGQQRTICKFKKDGFVTEDWQDTIFLALDTINQDAGFEYHFKDTIIITQAAAKMWYDDSQSDELSFAAEGEDSEDIKVWANFPFSYTGITYFATNNTGWFSIHRRQDNAVKDGDNYYYLFYIKTEANTEEERNGSVYVALKNKTEIKTETLSFTQLAPEPAPTYTRDVTAGNYGTICLPNAVNEGDYTGAVFYNIVGYQGTQTTPTGIVLESVEGNLEAGMPYIFRATANQIKAIYTGEAVDAPLTDEDKNAANGLMGSFETKDLSGDNIYGIKDNALRKLSPDGNQVGANRAYIDMSQMGPAAAAPAPAPGVHRVIMNNSSYSAPTNLNGLNGNVKATKVLRDGQLYIIRDTKTYNAQGIEL